MPSIFGIGIDLISVERVERAFSNKDYALKQVFSPYEIEYSNGKKNKFKHLAARFAVKEAVYKALAANITVGFRFTDIEVINGNYGEPLIRVRGKIKNLIDSLGIDSFKVSISHSQNYAIAMVILISKE